MTQCPSCSAPMKVGKTKVNSYGEVERRRYCKSCGRADVVGSQPEVVLWTHIVRSPHADHSVSNGVESSKDVARVQV